MVGDSVRMANLQAARSALRNEMAIQRLTGASQADMLVTQRRIQQIDDEIGRQRVYRAGLEENRVATQRLSSALQGTAAFATATGTALVAAGVFGSIGLKNLVDSAVEYERQAAHTSTQVDNFAASIKDVGDIGLRVAREIGVPFEQIQPALFDIFSSMEVGLEDAEMLLRIFAQGAVAGQTDIQSTARATIGILNAFQLPLTDINHLMDIQFQLVKEGVGSYEEWTQRIGLVTPSAARAGQTVEMMAAALAVSTRMGISAARSGTAVARAMDAMSNPAAVNALRELGVEALDANGNFRPMIDVLFDFRRQLEGLPDAEKIEKILDVFRGAGGTIEARRFLQNMLVTPGNLELFQEILGTMTKESGSFEKAYETMANTTATKSELIANKWEMVKIAAGEALLPTFNKILDVLGKLFDWFTKLSPRTQQTIVVILALAAAGAILLGGFLLLIGTIAGFAAAVATAGSVVFVVIGAFAGLGLAVAGFTAAIIVAWEKSEQFRAIIGDIRVFIERLWHEVLVPFAQEVKAAFDKHIMPAVNRFREVMEQKVMPVLRELHKTFVEKFLPAAKEVANKVRTVLAKAFEVIGFILDKYVIPAIERAVQYYNDHKETIDKLVGALIWLGKWLLIIALIVGGILALVFGGPIIAILLAFAAAVAAISAAIVWLYEKGEDLVAWFKSGWSSLKSSADSAATKWEEFKQKVINVWNKIKATVEEGWKFVISRFNEAIEFLKGLWRDFWESSIGGLLRSVWEFILSISELGFTILQFLFLSALAYIKTIWDTVWGAVVNRITEVWGFIGPYIMGAWEVLRQGAIGIWTDVKNFFLDLWEAISNGVVAVWNFIVSWLSSRWDLIRAVAEAKFEAVKAVIGEKIDGVRRRIVDAWEAIRHFFSENFGWFYDAGRSIIDNFIEGISSRIDKATEKVRELVQKIRDLFPFSPAKTGPLSGRGGMFYAGQKMVTQLQAGIDSKTALIAAGTNLLARNAGAAVGGLAAGNVGYGNQVEQNITVNTQEINPVRQSAELGWLLAGGI